MSKLYESREKLITKPLEQKELGYLFEGDLTYQLASVIKRKKYGSYLIGGVVGSGKTSQVKIASCMAVKNPLVVHMNFFNQVKIISDFERELLKALVDEIKEQKLDSGSEEMRSAVQSAKEKLQFETIRKTKINFADGSLGTSYITTNEEVGVGVGASRNKVLDLKGNLFFSKMKNNTLENTEEKKLESQIEYTFKEEALMVDVFKLIDALSQQEIVLIYDELDKVDDDVIRELFARYRELFVEKNIYNFFIVNEKIYVKYNNSDLCENPVFSYFMGRYYVPLLSFEKTLRYIVMMFGEKDYIVGIVSYYFSLGNYRLLNQRHTSASRCSDFDIFKAKLFISVMKSLECGYFEPIMVDMLKYKIKSAIESMSYNSKFNSAKLADELQASDAKPSFYPSYKTVIDEIISTVEENYPKSVERKGETIDIKWDNVLDEKLLIYENNSALENEGLAESEKVEDILFKIYKEAGYFIGKNKKIVFLNKDISMVKVSINEPKSYKEILTNLVYSHLQDSEIQAIVIKRARGDESFFINDYDYSGMVIIDKHGIQIAYYIEKGSYLSEDTYAIRDFVEDMQKLHVDIKVYAVEKEFELEENIDYVIHMFNCPYVKKMTDPMVEQIEVVDLWES